MENKNENKSKTDLNLCAEDIFKEFKNGNGFNLYKVLGCHKYTENNKEGYIFRVYAPNAKSVSVVGDFNFWNTEDLVMVKNEYGIFEAFSCFAQKDTRYKFYITFFNGQTVYKSDPFAFKCAHLPDTASVIYDIPEFEFTDRDYFNNLSLKNVIESPVNIYEVHLGSWQEFKTEPLNYKTLAKRLIPYIKDMGYTHIELMPITEYPFDMSWGYQVTGYFAPTFRYGSPTDFMEFVNMFHKENIGVILDWVPAHFPKDENGLYKFDGSFLFEDSDPLTNYHPEWDTMIFNYKSKEICAFLISSAVFWLKEYHLDGLRVDAVASMLYLDYGKKVFKPNKYGENKNLESISFLQNLNEYCFKANKNALMIAEESTAFPLVTKPKSVNGLGFNFKWNMGWMNDILKYMSLDPIYRKSNHNLLTFSLTYAFSENFVLPLSHDEVVHGKKSLIEKMPGTYEQKFENLKLLFGFMIAHPGKKLSFMGNDFAQFIEWDYKKPLDWFLLKYQSHKNFNLFIKELNLLYKSQSPFWENDSNWDGFKWISLNDNSQSVIAFRRIDKKGNEIICIFNFCPVIRKNYRLGLPKNKKYIPVFNSGSIKFNPLGIELKNVNAEEIPFHDLNFSGEFTLPPLSAIFYK